jgi:cell division ATPase FtsA
MSFRISHIHDYDRFIAIDLWTYRVRAGLYTIKNGVPSLEWSASIRQNQKNIVNGVIQDMRWVALVIDKAIHKACSHLTDIPEDIIIGFSPEVCIHDLMVSQYLRSDPELPLNMDELDLMIQKIEKASLIRAKKKAKAEYAVIHDDIRLISSTLTSITIDGKQVTSPLGLTGKHVRINILNVYSLASEYNILRSIISGMKKRTISIVPMPIIFPKILEHGKKDSPDNVYINIGYTYVTIVFEKHQEITFFDSFSTGASMLMEMFLEKQKHLSFTEIESILMRAKTGAQDEWERESIVREYFLYIIDTLTSVILRQEESTTTKNIFVSGGIFSSEWIEKIFFDIFSENIGRHGDYLHLSSVSNTPKNQSEYLLTTGLAHLGQELLHTKKDPIVRILRYTLYHYE